MKRIRCFNSFALFLPINFPTIKSIENITKPPKIIVNGIDKSPLTVSSVYNINNVKQGDKIKITLYPYSFKKITINKNNNEEITYKHIEIKEIGPFNNPSYAILTSNYNIADDGTEMTIDIDVNNLSDINYAKINFYFLGIGTTIYLYKT